MTYQKPDDHTVVSYAAKKCFLYTSIKNMTEMRPLIPLLIHLIHLAWHCIKGLKLGSFQTQFLFGLGNVVKREFTNQWISQLFYLEGYF